MGCTEGHFQKVGIFIVIKWSQEIFFTSDEVEDFYTRAIQLVKIRENAHICYILKSKYEKAKKRSSICADDIEK